MYGCAFDCLEVITGNNVSINNLFIYSKIVCLFVLRFYGSVNPMGSCRARSICLANTFTGQA